MCGFELTYRPRWYTRNPAVTLLLGLWARQAAIRKPLRPERIKPIYPIEPSRLRV